MQSEFKYRDYTVYHDGQEYVAEETTNDDAVVFEIGSPLLDNVIKAIDELYAAGEKGTVPDWYRKWYEEGVAKAKVKVDATRAKLPETVLFDPEGEFVLSGKDPELIQRTLQHMLQNRHHKPVDKEKNLHKARWVTSASIGKSIDELCRAAHAPRGVIAMATGRGKSYHLIHLHGHLTRG